MERGDRKKNTKTFKRHRSVCVHALTALCKALVQYNNFVKFLKRA